MRTAADFNSFYATPDPWRITQARHRDRALRRHIAPLVRGKNVLELGCGEGHLTKSVFNEASTVAGVDISDVAIYRAERLSLKNASFSHGDFLRMPFAGHDIITAIECVYYLSSDEREEFFSKARREHQGPLILSVPIIGENEHRRYFTHQELMKTLDRHRFEVCHFNLSVMRRNIPTTLAAIAARISPVFLDFLPESLVYQRLYILR